MLCDNCQKDNATVHCSACDKNYCRRRCWPEHWCGPLTDHDGYLVFVGDELLMQDRNYLVTEIPNTFAKLGLCYGNRIGRRLSSETRNILRPRLMRKIRGVTDVKSNKEAGQSERS